MNCPQCHIGRFHVRNSKGENLLVIVTKDKEVVPLRPEESLDGFDLETLYCLGCSWSGSLRMLTDKH